MRSICVIIVLLLALARAHAATIEVKLDNGSALIVVEGNFELADIETFRTKAAPLSKATVVFQSNGGRLLAGIRIGTQIRAKKFATSIPEGGQCASACALAWLGGTRRYIGKDATVGFHAAYVFRGDALAESGPGNAIVGAYLNQLGLPEQAILYVTRAAPNSMEWMTFEDAAKHGIAVALLPPPHSAPAVVSSDAAVTAAPERSAARRARRSAPNPLKRVQRNVQQFFAQLSKLRPGGSRTRTAVRPKAPIAR